MARRPVKRIDRKPSFFWQGVLILAPLIVLAKVGALAVWQDKRMARHEAELRAHDLAEQGVEAISKALQLEAPPAHAAPPAMNLIASLSPQEKSELDFYGIPAVKQMQVDAAGNLLHPAAFSTVPAPAILDVNQLPPEGRSLWEKGRAAAINDPAAAVELFRSLLATAPPTNFAAAAHLAAARGYLRQSNYPAAIEQFTRLKSDFVVNSESGLPLDVIARFELLQTRRSAGLLRTSAQWRTSADDLLRFVLDHPSAITERIIQRADVPDDLREKAKLKWEDDEHLRDIYRAAENSISSTQSQGAGWVKLTRSIEIPHETPAGVTPRRAAREYREPWQLGDPTKAPGHLPPATILGSNIDRFESSQIPIRDPAAAPVKITFSDALLNETEERWLMLRVTSGSNVTTWRVLSPQTVKQIVESAVSSLHLPQYLDAAVRVADAEIVSASELSALEHVVSGKGGGQYWHKGVAKDIPAMLASVSSGDGAVPILVAIHLIGPEMLYEQQRTRATWFGLLIGAAAVTSLIGFISAYRAFHRQIRLAEMKSNFVSSVSHELRAPIASVRLMAEGLDRGTVAEPAKQREYFKFIVQECRRLSSMIENVLDFARIDQGRKAYEFEPTDIAAVVHQTIRVMEPYGAERGVRVLPVIHCESGASEADFVITADGQALQQALVNLIDNAIKHSPSGEQVAIELESPQEDPPGAGKSIHISVCDHGPGIPASEHAKIFERFYRLGTELRRETPGVGIGLSIVKHIIEAHGGSVRVSSEPGRGSRFTLILPVRSDSSAIVLS